MKLHRLFAVVAALSLACPVRAVIIAGGDGKGNTNAPTDDPGWANVGRILQAGRGPAGVTYLGSNWFITAAHVWKLDNPTGVLVNASTYTVDTSSWHRITNTISPIAGAAADLAMFRVTEPVSALPLLTLRATSLDNGSPVIMIGDGKDRQSTMTFWDSAWNVTSSSSGVYSGFYWSATSGTQRWGSNTTDLHNVFIDDGFGTTVVYRTTFDANGDVNEAQGALYDSGGGVFYKNGTQWELVGLMITADGYSGQPASSSVFGNPTYSADLSYYHDQITTIMAIPEPSGVIVAGLGTLLAIRMIRRWRT
jgi:hypothetical protein